MDKVQQIREEIKRRRDKYRESREFIDAVRSATCTELLSFIDSLPEEPVSENLEGEIGNYIKSRRKVNKDIDWKESGISYEPEDLIAFANHIAKWQKQQMMKDAIAAEAYYVTGEGTLFDPSILPDNIKPKDKVKLIIIKED